MSSLQDLPNIGPELSKQLTESGILTYEDLVKKGTESAWLEIQKSDPSACIHRLYALEGAIQDIPKKALPAERKAELKAFYEQRKITQK